MMCTITNFGMWLKNHWHRRIILHHRDFAMLWERTLTANHFIDEQTGHQCIHWSQGGRIIQIIENPLPREPEPEGELDVSAAPIFD